LSSVGTRVLCIRSVWTALREFCSRFASLKGRDAVLRVPPEQHPPIVGRAAAHPYRCLGVMCVATRTLFSFWVERALPRTLAQRATERAFHQGYQGHSPCLVSL
jgi:hypothetical protein